MTVFLIFLLILFFMTVTAASSGGIVRVTKQKEWTRFENGRPVCGVGKRGYWTNKIVEGGDSPFIERSDGTWYDPKTGKDCVVMSLRELMKRNKIGNKK